MPLSEIIKAHRLANNLTQEEMARKMHMEKQTYARWENGKTRMTNEKLQLFAAALGIEVADIYSTPHNKIINLLHEKAISENTAERDYGAVGTINNYYYGDTELNAENEKLKALLVEKDNLLNEKDKLLIAKDEQIETLRELLKFTQKKSS